MELFYGPVLSRRFGYSLGIDIIPYKVCSYDCIYCQLGSTTKKTVDRKSYIKLDMDQFEKDLTRIIDNNERIDYVTFSGSGEPTLNIDMGKLIRKVKKTTGIPVAVLTNGSLLHRADVLKDIIEADLIKVSMDAPDQKIFEVINKPYPGLHFADLSRGLNMLMKNYRGRIWLEIMMIKGINDSLEAAYDFEALLKSLQKEYIKADLENIHLNTPIRPTETGGLGIPDSKRLEEFRKMLGKKAVIIKDYEISKDRKKDSIMAGDIISLARRRPVTVRDISKSLDININEVIKAIKVLMERNEIRTRMHNNRKYYYV